MTSQRKSHLDIVVIILLILACLPFSTNAETFSDVELGFFMAVEENTTKKEGYFNFQTFLESLSPDLLDRTLDVILALKAHKEIRSTASVPLLPSTATSYETGLYACPADIAPGIYAIYVKEEWAMASHISVATIHAGNKLLDLAAARDKGLGVFSIQEGEILKIEYRDAMINPISQETAFIKAPGDWFTAPGIVAYVGIHIPAGEYQLVANATDNPGLAKIKEGRETVDRIDVKQNETTMIRLKADQMVELFFADLIWKGP